MRWRYEKIEVPAGVRVLRSDAVSGAVAVSYRLEGNVWRLLHLERGEMRALMSAAPELPARPWDR